MMKSNKFRRLFRAASVIAATAALTLASCTKVDDTLGGNLIPDNQQMKAGFVTLDGTDKGADLNPRKYVETRLFQTDSIFASNLGTGYMGSLLNDTMGLRTAGFLSQYVNYYLVDEGYFGYRPIFDSAQIMLSFASYGGDTLTDQTFAVYEVTSNKYITEKPLRPKKTVRDTVFYLNFDPIKAGILGEKLFTFKMGKSSGKGPASKAVTMEPTAAGKEFISRLMLQSGKYKDNYSIYKTENTALWVEEFKGVYIVPEQDQTEMGKGAVYTATLNASGLSIYGRNRLKSDPSLIKDTIGMVYYFYDSYASAGNVSINTVRHDYSKATSPAKIDIEQAKEQNTNRPENPRAYVEGMGGVGTEITFTQEFFNRMEELLQRENTVNGKLFKDFAFSNVRMSIYFNGSDYDWSKINPGNTLLINGMNAAPNRLGLYTDLKTQTGITDYAYYYEKTYSMTLAYGGYINRSHGCYVMDITGYAQELWASYAKEKKAAAAEGRAIKLDNIKKRKIYLAPEAYGLYTTATGVFQGMATNEGSAISNNAPIRFDIAYNMIK